MAEFAFAFMDCEFGGLDPELHDITEVALILTDYRLAELGLEGVEGARAARSHHGRGRGDPGLRRGGLGSRGAAAAPGAARELSALLPKDKKVVPSGQNVRMDVIFLERGFRSCEIPYPFDYHVIDLATLYYAWSLVAGETVQALSLRQAATAAGLVQGAVPHRALADARLTLETFRHYVGRLAPRRAPEEALAAVVDAARAARRADATSRRRSRSKRASSGNSQRASRPRGGSTIADAKSISTGCCVLVDQHVAAMAQVEVHDAARVHLAHGVGDAIAEAGEQLAAEAAREVPARPVLDREGERVDAAEQSRHRGMTRERAVGAHLAARDPAADRRAHPRRARREVLHDDEPAARRRRATRRDCARCRGSGRRACAPRDRRA